MVQAVILAAGQGTRLRALGASKPMVSVEGTALLERVIRNAMAGGVDNFVIVTGYNSGALQKFIADLDTRLSCTITCVTNDDWHLGNGHSVLAAREHADDTFHVLMADHLIDPAILRRVRGRTLHGGGACLGVDFRLTNPHVDIEDVTKVMCKDNKIMRIGKTLTAFNGFDTGVFWCSPGLFHAIDESIATTGDDSLSGGVSVLAAAGLMACCDVGGHTWIDVDTPAVLDLAQQALTFPSSAAG